MKTICGLYTAIAIALGALSVAGAADKYFVVKITDLAENHEYKVMNQEDWKALEKEVADEKRLWAKAMTLAQKDWQGNETYKGKPFPQGSVKARSVKVMGSPYTEESKAEDKVSTIEENEAEKIAEEEEKAKEKAQKAGAKAKDKGKDNEKENMYTMARTIFQQKLDEAKALDQKAKEAKAGGGEAAAAPKEGGEKKAE